MIGQAFHWTNLFLILPATRRAGPIAAFNLDWLPWCRTQWVGGGWLGLPLAASSSQLVAGRV